MGMWTRTLVVVYQVYCGQAGMETGKASRSLMHEGSWTRELNAAGQREREREIERMAGLCSRVVAGHKN
jgi:hypothetical protein